MFPHYNPMSLISYKFQTLQIQTPFQVLRSYTNTAGKENHKNDEFIKNYKFTSVEEILKKKNMRSSPSCPHGPLDSLQ